MASSGVLVSAQMPPAIPNTTRIITRNAFRALVSMMRSSRNCFLGSGDGLVAGVSISALWLPGLDRALHLSFGVHQEISAGHDAFAFLEAGSDLVEFAVLSTQFDVARLQLAFALVDEHDVVSAGGQHSRDGNPEAFAHIHGYFCIHVHVRAQF